MTGCKIKIEASIYQIEKRCVKIFRLTHRFQFKFFRYIKIIYFPFIRFTFPSLIKRSYGCKSKYFKKSNIFVPFVSSSVAGILGRT